MLAGELISHVYVQILLDDPWLLATLEEAQLILSVFEIKQYKYQ